MRHTVGTSLVVGQDPTYKILDAASFGKYLAVASDKLLFIYFIREGTEGTELVLDLVKELKLPNAALTNFRSGVFIKSKKILYFLSQELEMVQLLDNIYAIAIMNDYILTSSRDKLSLMEFNERMMLKRETRSSIKYNQMEMIDQHTALLQAKSGVYILDVVTWQLKIIYSNSKLIFNFTPHVTVSRNEIIITKDDQSAFYYKNGLVNKTITWTSKVVSVLAFQVNVMGLLDSNIEIRNVNTGDLIQVLDIQGASVMSQVYGNKMFICDDHTIWQFSISGIMEQVGELVGLNMFEEAQELITASDLGDQDKLINYKGIQLQYARYTYLHKDAKKTLELLDEIKANPKTCIDLFLGVSIDDIFIEKKMLLVLMDYLSRQRAGISRRLRQLDRINSEVGTDIESAYSMVDTYDGEGFDSEEELLVLSGLVDTALFRIYLELNHSLLGSLFRVPNFIDQSAVERILPKREKWDELVEFYKGKKLHEKALNVLKKYVCVK
jgi:hypothetical protein